MMSKKGKKLRLRRFCNEFVRCHNGTKAAISAGFSVSSASVMACRLLKRSDVQLMIDNLATKIEVTEEKLIQEVAKTAFAKAKGRPGHSDKTRNLELLMKHKRMLVDRVEHQGLEGLAERLMSARQNLKKSKVKAK